MVTECLIGRDVLATVQLESLPEVYRIAAFPINSLFGAKNQLDVAFSNELQLGCQLG